MKDRLLLIRTGGTIDGEPYADPKSPPSLLDTLKGADSLIVPTVKTLPHHERVDFLTWGNVEEDRFVKDSQLYTPEDIKALARIIESDPHTHFILTHGTVVMVKNAQWLQQELQGCGKVMAMVGAMTPLSMAAQYGSDGIDALRFALEHTNELTTGVHIVGTGLRTKKWGFFNPAEVQKDNAASLARMVFTLGPVVSS
jgi:L-asparaginase/Glu-tRNA(Gln) amidotransferase subunit D